MISREVIEDFLYYEASLLDVPDLDTWMNLFTEDGYYWMPATEAQQDPINHISHVYDDRVMMEIRRRNFVHPRAASKEFNIRCSHLIGNIRVTPAEPDAGTEIPAGAVRVTSNQHVIVWYRDEQRIYAYRGEHVLVAVEDSFKIVSKQVMLINPEAAQRSLTIYL